MGRKRIHDEQATYFEKYGSVPSSYDQRRRVDPNFIYDIYVVHGHYKMMDINRMKSLLKQILPALSKQKREKVNELLKKLKR